jgi:hypothetical protein
MVPERPRPVQHFPIVRVQGQEIAERVEIGDLIIAGYKIVARALQFRLHHRCKRTSGPSHLVESKAGGPLKPACGLSGYFESYS